MINISSLLHEFERQVIEKVQTSINGLKMVIHDRLLSSHLEESFNDVQNYLLTFLSVIKEAFNKFN